MPLTNSKSKLWVHWIAAAVGALLVLLLASAASAQSCNIRNNAPDFIRYDLTNNYCELCGYGYITIVIANPYDGADMTNIRVEADLSNPGLVFDENAPDPMRVNGIPVGSSAYPDPGNILIWTTDELDELDLLAHRDFFGNYSSLTLTFAVRRVDTPEDLVDADRTIHASISFDNDANCPEPPAGELIDTGELYLRQPVPQVTKTGWNYDAGQREGSADDEVYGHNDDDIVWRIRIRNNGDAGMQDVQFRDVLQAPNMNISHACTTAAAANTIAANNGGGPIPIACEAVDLDDDFTPFIVEEPYGDMASSWDDHEVDVVVAGGSASIYLVGKIDDDGSCEGTRKSNTVDEFEWGCEAQEPAGGIRNIQNGTPPTAEARLYTKYGEESAALSITRQLTGTNRSQPVGSKGNMRIIIRNRTGGSVKNIELTDTLPSEYVMDPTFTPTASMNPRFGTYPGMIDNITWTNEQSDPLDNTTPRFVLTSSSENNGTTPVQRDMMRHGDRLIIDFRVVLIESDYYDRQANLDVNPEVYSGTDPTDPPYEDSLSNRLRVEFDTFCDEAPGPHQSLQFNDTNIDAFPEDLDIAIGGDAFILTNDRNQLLTLPVTVTNNGGHDAADYHVFVSFGATMEVVDAPSTCREIAVFGNPLPGDPPQPHPWKVWVKSAPDPIAIPDTATVYECTGDPIAPGPTGSVTYEFDVRKSNVNARVLLDDLSFRADVVGEIILSDGTTLLTFPTPFGRTDGETDRANNYSLDTTWARVIGFNLKKNQLGPCNENNPPTYDALGYEEVQIGEECRFRIETGGWFGFKTPGFAYIAVQNIDVVDEVPDGQAYIASSDPRHDPAEPDNTSTSRIKGVSLNPPGLSPLQEGWFDWRFNVTDAERIEVADEWFRVDTTTRLLNKPSQSGDPNYHNAVSFNVLNSTFDATFRNDNNGVTEKHTLGPGTEGYPRQPIRQVDLRVTEPNVTVVKEVCNESKNGFGPTCDGFRSEIPGDDPDAGDAYDSYIYRLTITDDDFEDVRRAPAYDVTVTDVLDSSDLAYVLPFGSDGLDNDADGSSDSDDSDEGAISDNEVNKNGPAVITFSYTHSDALLRLEPGESVQLYYRVDYDDHAAPLQTFTNTAHATYDSLEGEFGSQSDPQEANGELGGARVYTSDPDTASVQIVPVKTGKDIAALSNTPMVGESETQGVSIGEEIDYRLHTDLPVALLRNFTIEDELPEGMRCIEAPAINLSEPPYDVARFAPGGPAQNQTCNGGRVTWEFGSQRVTNGDVGDYFDFEIGFIARVENIDSNRDGARLVNGNQAFVRYQDEEFIEVIIDFEDVEVEVREPRIELTKDFGVATADAGDVLTVTVTATNEGTATAYNLRVLDDLTGRKMTFGGDTGGSDPPDSVDRTTRGPNQPIFGWNRGIAPGAAISFTFDVSVDDDVQPLEVLDNTIQAAWTSLPGKDTALNSELEIGEDGAPDGMRIGALPNIDDDLNDYESQASAQVTVPALALTKRDRDPAIIPTIGAHKSFQIDIPLPEGVTKNVVVTDSLDEAGESYRLANNDDFDITYTFRGIAAINGSTPSEAALRSFPADGTRGSVVWDIGTVVTRTEDDLDRSDIAPLIRIRYFARANNDMVTDDGDALQNAVELNYTHGETESLSAATDEVDVVEPRLRVVKVVANVTPGKQPDDTPAGGDLLEYEISVFNQGTATAHDVNLVDTLPPELTLYSGFTPTAAINGTPVAGFQADPANAPAGPLVWGRENGDGSLDIPAGQSLVLTYRVVVQQVGGDLENRAWVDWTSLDGESRYERTGRDCPETAAPNDYCDGPAVAGTPTVDENRIEKSVSSDTFDTPPFSTISDEIARVGDVITYRLALYLSGGLTRNLRVQDFLPGGMEFASVVRINEDSSPDYTPPPDGIEGSSFAYAPIPAANVPAAGDTGTLTWNIGDIVNDPFGNPPTDTFEIIYRVRIKPDAGLDPVPSSDLTNAVRMDYETAAGPAPTRTDNARLRVVQPVLAVTKSAVAAGGDTVLSAGEIVTYTVEIANSGDAPAYDAMLRDVIPVGMRNGAATITVERIELVSGTVLPNLAPVYDAGSGVATWDFDSGGADAYTIPPRDTLRIVYRVQADVDLGAGMTLTNRARVQQYYSFDDEDTPRRGGVSGERQAYGPSNTDRTTFTTDPPAALSKANPAELTVAVGEPFTYRVTVPAAPHDTALHDVRIVDDLRASAADLRFVSVVKFSGSRPWMPVNTGTATNLVIEDPDGGIDIPAGEQIVIDITVLLEDTDTNVSGLQFHNTAGYTYNQIGDDPDTRATGGSDTTADMTIVGPDALNLEKSGPDVLQVGSAGTFTLNLHNTGSGSGAAWNPVITDRLPHGDTGGTCGTGPSNVRAQVFESDGITAVADPLTPGTDFAVEFEGEPTCEWRFRLLSEAGGLAADRRLIVHYDVELDLGTVNDVELTNLAGVTRWFSADPEAADAAPRIYERQITDGTPGTLDHQDSHIVTAEAPILSFQMAVQNMTTGQDPGSDASPGDTLRYTIELENSGPVGLQSFRLRNEVDALNGVPVFVPGSLTLIRVPTDADTSATDPAGGTHGSGLLDVGNLSIGAAGEADAALTVVFETTLVPVIDSGTVVLDQAELVISNPTTLYSDDPNVGGDEDPTETLITSAPEFEVLKTATILSGEPDVLMAGETLRYTLTIRNVGTENTEDVTLRDYTPANTAYVEGSTTLNGEAVADPSPGVSPLEGGMPVNAPEDATAGYLRADATPGATNVATVTFDVVVDPSAMDGLVIKNQGFVRGSGMGSGPQPEQPSDDPTTPIPDDPTRTVVGNLPLLYALKTVQIQTDSGSPGIVDPGDVLRYAFVIHNFGAIPATEVTLTDEVPTHTRYVAGSLRLNGDPSDSDGGLSPLTAGLPLQSSDNPGAGIITAGGSAEITFDARVDADAAPGTLIRNQGSVASDELPAVATDADGLPSNGNQPTVVLVGEVQLVLITKQVAVVGGGAAVAGSQLEYALRVTNIGSLPATRVMVVDDLSPPLGEQVTYSAGSGTLNGVATGVTYTDSTLTADYAARYGDLAPGDSFVVRFRVQIGPDLDAGTTITNTGEVRWNDPVQNAAASISIDVGGTPGSAALNGNVWHDANLDKVLDADNETRLEGWSVELYYGGQPVTSVLTGADGDYHFNGLVPNAGSAMFYELRFRAAGAGPNTASLGTADSPFTNGPQRIREATAASGANLQNLNLPLWPNGAVYNSVTRLPVAGAALAMGNAATGEALPSQCFEDPSQQNQVTAQDGFYKFDLNFSQESCPADGAYLIEVTAPATGYLAAPSQIIPPASNTGTAPFVIPTCPGSADDAVPETTEYCEATTFALIPPLEVPPDAAETNYYLHFVLGSGSMPGHSQVFNNPIPIDPELDGAVSITKTSPMVNVVRGSLVPYTITVSNMYGAPLYNLRIVDRLPPGFKYVADSARLDGSPVEPQRSSREVFWDDLRLQVNQKITLQLLLVVGSGVSEGEYVNRAQVIETAIGGAVSGEATATVRVVPDPDFDCTDVIGKVFDDENLNGRQDAGEEGLAGVRVVTVQGLIATTDEHGRFHITCAVVPDEDQGSNFILKLDERSLPAGYRLMTENPRVQRATRGKMIRINFGATIHRVVRLDIADGVFEPDTTRLRLQWNPRLDLLVAELQKAPSVLRLSYLADVEREGLVRLRLSALKEQITRQWEQSDGDYRLSVETEVFWRRGGPVGRR